MAGMEIEYEKFINHVFKFKGKGCYGSGRRMIVGKFKEKGLKRVHTETFEVISCGDAEKSYAGAVAYFNRTLRPGEKERVAVSAEWLEAN